MASRCTQSIVSLDWLRKPAGTEGDPPVAITPEVRALLADDCVVAIGVSGGKDSQACAIAVSRFLDAIGHTGPRVLVHADLGVVEWKDSLPCCERLAAHLGWELLVVRRKAGDMLARWQGRWANNVARYRDLSCVRLILPWSTPSMRFCTSELKVDVITSALRKRYPTQAIVNVAGIRRQESARRKKAPVSAPQAKLKRKAAVGVTWNAIIEWTVDEVFACIERAGLALHEAYTRYKSTRVSCVFCIMGSGGDLLAATTCADNLDVYIQMVELEAESTYAFQGAVWLADVAPHLLPDALRARVARAKEIAAQRQRIEAEIPKHLLYTKGWPTAMPTMQEAEFIAHVRRQIGSLMGWEVACTSAESVLARYSELMAMNPDVARREAEETDDMLCAA